MINKYFLLGFGVAITIATIGCEPQAQQQDAAQATEPQELTTLAQRFSYAVGMNVGQQLKGEEAEIDVALIAQAISDVYADKEMRLSEEEVRTVFQEYQQQMMEKQQKARVAAAEANKLEGEKFLAENAKKEGVITLPSGLQYKVITPGTGPKPTAQDTVTVHYRGTLIDGTEFDSSYQRNAPVSFPLGNVIPGWTEGLQLMQEGAKWELYIPSDLAYGPGGSGPTIGPNATLIFQVELLKAKAGE